VWGFDGGVGGGCLCNVWLLFYGYPLVSAAGQYFVESKFNYKIYRYIKTYFNLYDLSLQFKFGQSQGGGRNRFSGWSLQSLFVLEWEPVGIGCRLILRRTKFQVGGGANLSS
jgi:hypothetical protein